MRHGSRTCCARTARSTPSPTRRPAPPDASSATSCSSAATRRSSAVHAVLLGARAASRARLRPARPARPRGRRRGGARSAPPSAPGGASSRTTNSRSIRPLSVASSAAKSANRCIRSLRARSSPGRLRPAQHQHGEQGLLVARQAGLLVEQVAVLGRAAGGGQPGPAPAAEAVQRAADRLLVVVDDRVAVGRLVARVPQRVQGQRVGVGRGALLLDQAARARGSPRGRGPCGGTL